MTDTDPGRSPTTAPAGRSIRRVPTGTYRVQLTPDHGFDEVARRVPYLASLGVSHLYLSPILQAAPGSTHGYDVVDHSQVSVELGGRDGLERLATAAHDHGLGIVVDVVPNHMAVPVPAHHNRALWSVLRDGPASAHASWFDIDWSGSGQALLMPILGDPIGDVLAAGDLAVDPSGDEPVLRYFDHVFPLREGTAQLPVEELLDQQWYRLAWWRVADEELNYRRFFDVDSLAGLRVERPEVFDATHELTLSLVRDGVVDGLRIDHPDGLSDPDAYLARLADAAPGAWVVVEKIVGPHEELPESWRCDGTTGYEALTAVNGLFIDDAGYRVLAGAYAERTGADLRFEAVADVAKREVLTTVLAAEVERLVDLAAQICAAELALRDHSRRALHDAVVALLVAVDRYRIYVRPGQAPPADEAARSLMTSAVERACDQLPAHRHATLRLVADLALLDRGDDALHAEWCIRFQQTSVSAMAKGVEDTALYRWLPMAGANEVGGEPGDPATTPDDFHAFADRLHRTRPGAMTTLSTHDTKRGEDTRARLAVLTEIPDRWGEHVETWHEVTVGLRTELGPDRLDEELIWQTLVGLWPLDGGRDPSLDERVSAYVVKAMREAKRHTSWVEPDERYEEATTAFVSAVLDDDEAAEGVEAFAAEIAPAARANVLGQKLVQLTMPGVPDVYQGAELEWLAVVDPDNRRPLDDARYLGAVDQLDGGGRPRDLSEEKLLVTRHALRLRRDHPSWFGPDGDHEPLLTSSNHLFGFLRAGRVAVLVSRLMASAPDLGAATVALPAGRWTNVLAGRAAIGSDGSPVPAGDVLDALPVALLVEGLEAE